MTTGANQTEYVLGESLSRFRWRGKFVLEGANAHTPDFLVQDIHGDPSPDNPMSVKGARINGEFGSPTLVLIKGATHSFSVADISSFRILNSSGVVLFSLTGGSAQYPVPLSSPAFLSYDADGETGEIRTVFSVDFIVYRKGDLVRDAVNGSMYVASQTTFGIEPRRENSGFDAVSFPQVVHGGTF